MWILRRIGESARDILEKQNVNNLDVEEEVEVDECLEALTSWIGGNPLDNSQFVNALLYTGKMLNDLGDWEKCKAVPENVYMTFMCLDLPISVTLGICGPRQCGMGDYDKLTDTVVDLLNTLLHSDQFSGTIMAEYTVKADQIMWLDMVFLRTLYGVFSYGFWLCLIFIASILIFVLVATVIDTYSIYIKNQRGTGAELRQPSFMLAAGLPRGREEVKEEGVEETGLRPGSILMPLNEDMMGGINQGSVIEESSLLPMSEHYIDHPEPPKPPSVMSRICRCCNILRNYKQLTQGKNSLDANTNVLNGLRFIAMLWIIYGHVYFCIIASPLYNYMVFAEVAKDFWFAAIANFGYATDVFFFLTAFLVSSYLYSEMRKPYYRTWKLYLHRYLRLLPMYIITWMLYTHIIKLTNNGPLYVTYYQRAGDCMKYFYYHFLFINNFKQFSVSPIFGEDWSRKTECMEWTFYLADDFQFFLLVPLLIWLYRSRGKRAYFYGVICLLWAMYLISTPLVTYYKELSPSYLRFSQEYLTYYFYPPWTRISPFLIGIFVGLMYASYREEGVHNWLVKMAYAIRKFRFLRWGMYTIGAFIMFWMIYAFYWMANYPRDWSQADDSAFLTFMRPLFTFGVALIFTPALLGRAKPLRKLLGNQAMTFLSKLTYGIYMIHPLLMEYRQWSLQKAIYVDHLQVFLEALGYTGFSVFLAFLGYLLLENPILNLEREFLLKRKSKFATDRKDSVLTAQS